MKKIIILQGPPASGKSTLALQLHLEDRTRVIVSRDAIRESRGEYWLPDQEDYISEIEMFQVKTALKHNLTPIIDATNLNPKTIEKWKNLAEEENVEIKWIECVVDFKEACKRDEERGNKVGKKVLKKFYQQYYPQLLYKFQDDRLLKPFESKPKVILCDLDGTLALRTNRSPYDFEKVDTDVCDFRLAELIKTLNVETQYDIIFLSGREDIGNCREKTEKWLHDNVQFQYWESLPGVKEDNWKLLMRKKGDHRPDEIVKKEIYETEIAPHYDVVAVFDDRDKVVKMWRDLGLLCCQVYYGNF